MSVVDEHAIARGINYVSAQTLLFAQRNTRYMIVGTLHTVFAILSLSVIFALPFISLYIAYELAWPRVFQYILALVSKN
jgi:hypothetical protein